MSPNATPAKSETSTPTPDQATGDAILVVDDATSLRRLVALVLGRDGYKVVEASSGQAALDLLTTAPSKFRLLVTDLSMPGMSGFDLIHQAKQAVPGLKLLAMTGSYTFGEIEGILLDLGLSKLLHKPFDHSELLNAVREAFATPDSADPLAD